MNIQQERFALSYAVTAIINRLEPGVNKTFLLDRLHSIRRSHAADSEIEYTASTVLPEEQWIDFLQEMLNVPIPFLEKNLGAMDVAHLADLAVDIRLIQRSGATSYEIKRQINYAYTHYRAMDFIGAING